jgi:Cytochrome c554 and c-prime/Tetratricopeptide repeat
MRSTLLLLLALLLLAACSEEAPGEKPADPVPPPEVPAVPPEPEPDPDAVPGAPQARFVGRQTCVVCHKYEDDLHEGSDHDLAMDVATEETVLGDFNNAVHERHGVRSTFFRREGAFLVRTEGPDGKLADYEVKYVFGVRPLQQYLVPFPRGRLQTLALCWDTRTKEEGGQRWFHIYPEDHVSASDFLHWTGPNQNWNFMCAECHSTNLRKGYDLATDTYDTTWSEIDVSCEACHGPGSEHLVWAEKVAGLVEDDPAAAKLETPKTAPLKGQALIDACARCHSRRTELWEDYTHGQPFADTHRLSLLTGVLYFDDGQIKDEVYVIGSFRQSRMFHEGITCTDCHEDKTPQWSEAEVAKWYGAKRKTPWHFGEALHAARTGAPEATDLLLRLIDDPKQPSIARATGRLDEAQGAYRTALRIAPGDEIATVNLADLYRVLKRDDLGERILREGIAARPGSGAIQHSLGLLLIRQKRVEESLPFLLRAMELRPDIPRYGYVYAVALKSADRMEEAIRTLEAVLRRHGDDFDVIEALALFNLEAGAKSRAIFYGEKLLRIRPDDPDVRALLEHLKRR